MRSIKNILKDVTLRELEKRGYRVERLSRHQKRSYKEFHERAETICSHHWQQDKETAIALRNRYEQPVFGKVRVWELIELLGTCVDPGDRTLYCTSQLTHVLQMLEAMERDGVSDEGLYIAALVHDIGKVLLLTGEHPEHIVGGHQAPIGKHEHGIGLDNCLLQWDHGELAYRRLKDYLPDYVAWLIRYHAILPKECEPFMDERDRTYVKLYFHTFYKYDCGSKSPYSLPKVQLEKYRDLVERTFPEAILF
jgi:hypothetical protein